MQSVLLNICRMHEQPNASPPIAPSLDISLTCGRVASTRSRSRSNSGGGFLAHSIQMIVGASSAMMIDHHHHHGRAPAMRFGIPIATAAWCTTTLPRARDYVVPVRILHMILCFHHNSKSDIESELDFCSEFFRAHFHNVPSVACNLYVEYMHNLVNVNMKYMYMLVPINAMNGPIRTWEGSQAEA